MSEQDAVDAMLETINRLFSSPIKSAGQHASDVVVPMKTVSGAGYTKAQGLLGGGGYPKISEAAKNWVSDLMERMAEDAATNPSFWHQSVNTTPGTFNVKLLTDAARRMQAGHSLHGLTSFGSTPKAPPRCDNFGTDYTKVDRMANPYRPGTVPHTYWMSAWVDAQYHWQTDQYKAHHAEVTEARAAMIESCAPVANWVDEVLHEVAEARDECEDVYDPSDRYLMWLDEINFSEISMEFDGPTPSSVGQDMLWHIRMTARVDQPLDLIHINIV